MSEARRPRLTTYSFLLFLSQPPRNYLTPMALCRGFPGILNSLCYLICSCLGRSASDVHRPPTDVAAAALQQPQRLRPPARRFGSGAQHVCWARRTQYAHMAVTTAFISWSSAQTWCRTNYAAPSAE